MIGQVSSCPTNLRDLFHFNPESVHQDLLSNAHQLDRIVENPAWGIYTFPLLSPDFCKALIWFSDLVGNYAPDPLDPYPGQEFRTAEVTPLHQVVELLFGSYMQPLVEHCFSGYKVEEIANSFVLRYTMDTQKSMGLHFDADGLVSMTIALNNDFEGGGLDFPAYDWSTKGLPVGHAVAFPSQVTHHHRGLEITSGERHAFVMWLK